MPHSFHIPVMGTGFTLDTPLSVARYGIASVMSLVDDGLIEKIHEHYCQVYGEVFAPVSKKEEFVRAKRITAYLNFVSRQVKKQLEQLRNSAFEKGSEITKYFELLDDETPLKRAYQRMLQMSEGNERKTLQAELRSQIVAGSIDVNIMTKQQRDIIEDGVKLPLEYSDTFTALQGFSESELDSSVVFSAGLNPPLYTYVENFEDFYPDEFGKLRKKIILKVSDYRSALIQGKIFAKKGLWISEFRIESGLNCGGHAFPTEGILLGPILEEFKRERETMIHSLFDYCQNALEKKEKPIFAKIPPIRFTVQGGLGTSSEDKNLRKHYDFDGTGWGSPFLLVPEATSVDDETLKKLTQAEEGDIYLSGSSPLGVPYYNLKNSASNTLRQERIVKERPGSPCITKAMTFDKEFPGLPLCTASAQYQEKKIQQLESEALDEKEFSRRYEQIVKKECICHNLGGGIVEKKQLNEKKDTRPAAICPGPNLIFFSRLYSLSEMVGHIYGKNNLLPDEPKRPHVFINELRLYINYLKEEVLIAGNELSEKEMKHFRVFKENLLLGIEYYKSITAAFFQSLDSEAEQFLTDLSTHEQDLIKFDFSTPNDKTIRISKP